MERECFLWGRNWIPDVRYLDEHFQVETKAAAHVETVAWAGVLTAELRARILSSAKTPRGLVKTQRKIQSKCTNSFLCCIIKQSTSYHFLLFAFQRSILPPSCLYQKDERAQNGKLQGHIIFRHLPCNTRRFSSHHTSPLLSLSLSLFFVLECDNTFISHLVLTLCKSVSYLPN